MFGRIQVSNFPGADADVLMKRESSFLGVKVFQGSMKSERGLFNRQIRISRILADTAGSLVPDERDRPLDPARYSPRYDLVYKFLGNDNIAKNSVAKNNHLGLIRA